MGVDPAFGSIGGSNEVLRDFPTMNAILDLIVERLDQGFTPKRVLVSDQVGIAFMTELQALPGFTQDGIDPVTRWQAVDWNLPLQWSGNVGDRPYSVRILKVHDCVMHVPIEFEELGLEPR